MRLVLVQCLGALEYSLVFGLETHVQRHCTYTQSEIGVALIS